MCGGWEVSEVWEIWEGRRGLGGGNGELGMTANLDIGDSILRS